MSPTESRMVRCAVALGYKPATRQSLIGIWWWEPGDVEHVAPTCELPPFGENTPEGLACTMGFIERFGLSLVKAPEGGRYACGNGGRRPDLRVTGGHHDPCAAVAEWVAAHVECGKVKA